jgi:hypothetical protein
MALCTSHRARSAGRRTESALAVVLLLLAGCGDRATGGSVYSVSVEPSGLSFTAEQYGPLPGSRSLVATFRGDGLMVGYPEGTTAPAWLSLVVAGSGPESATISASVNTTDLAPGVYTATVRFVTGAADGSDHTLRDVPVRYEVTPGAYALTGTRDVTVTEAASASELDRPLTLTTHLGAAEGAACTFRITSSAPWLTVTPDSGNLSADTPLVAHLSADALWALPNGFHDATLSVALDAGCPRATAITVTYSLQLDLRPALSTAPSAVPFTVTATSTSPDCTKSVTVSSNLGDAFAARGGWTAALSDTWATVTPAGGVGGGAVAIELTPTALSSLSAGLHSSTLSIVAADPRVAAPSVPVTLDMALPIVAHVAPGTTWVNRSAKIIIRGSGFMGTTVPVRIGADVVTAAVVSGTELHATLTAPSSPARLVVRIENALGIDRGGADLVVLPEPGYAALSLSLAKRADTIALDPERQAILITGWDASEVLRLRFADGSWTEEHVALSDANGVAVALDGRRVLVHAGKTSATQRQIVELDADTLATTATAGFSSYYDAFKLIAPLNDGRTMLLDSDQWMEIRWYPGFTSTVAPSAYYAAMRLTRDRSRLLVRSAYPSGIIHSYDASEADFRERFQATATGSQNWDVSGDGDRMLDGLDVYDRGFTKLGSLVLPDPRPADSALAPDGSAAYTLSKVGGAWVLRRTDVSAASGPYVADATPLPFVLPAGQTPYCTRVSEDGGALFIVSVDSSMNTKYFFHAVPLP